MFCPECGEVTANEPFAWPRKSRPGECTPPGRTQRRGSAFRSRVLNALGRIARIAHIQ